MLFRSERIQQQLAESCKNVSDTGCLFWAVEPNVGRVANGIPARVHRLKALGNGQVPMQAAVAWKILEELINDSL